MNDIIKAMTTEDLRRFLDHADEVRTQTGAIVMKQAADELHRRAGETLNAGG